MRNLYVALTHYPVVNKQGDTITAAVTNLDLHDISRAAKTYGVRSFYVVTPLFDQQEFVSRIVSHWTEGEGSRYNPSRRQALELIVVKDSLHEVVADIARNGEGTPKTVVTSARPAAGSLSFGKLREMLQSDQPYLVIFGTAWGLSEHIIQSADHILEPVQGNADYNHLSVRSAVAIILDRLIGK